MPEGETIFIRPSSRPYGNLNIQYNPNVDKSIEDKMLFNGTWISTYDGEIVTEYFYKNSIIRLVLNKDGFRS